MSLAELLKKKQLKHVQPEEIRITELPKETEDERQHKQKEVALDILVDIEKWYPLLGDVTFSTEFVHVNKNQAGCFVRFFKTREDPLLQVETKERILKEIRGELSDLEREIARMIEKFGGSVFVKTSSRSPKDAVELGGRLRNLFDKITVSLMIRKMTMKKECSYTRPLKSHVRSSRQVTKP
eukprot:TRINITY_DN1023_c0_g2_i14.p1 TRINITY_DN1023_c0_g2~~TRINITY_DN1023_c0_g2_i14.p1  ORF type:complete len:182 (-),score=30.01 TRINITY_DN1023_c0_g2_i14:636-1181(-)